MRRCDGIVVGATVGGAEAPPARGAVQPLWQPWPAFPSRGDREIGNGCCRTTADQILRCERLCTTCIPVLLQRELGGCSLLPRYVTHYRASEEREYCDLEERIAVTFGPLLF